MKQQLFTTFLLLALFVAGSLYAQPFMKAPTIGTANEPLVIYFADLDGDGDNDMIGADGWADQIFWQENLGGGIFGPKNVLTSFADTPTQAAAADMDNDGDMDIVSTAYTGNRLAWYENLGGGNFAIPVTIDPVITNTFEMVLRDVNQDGLTDIVVAALFGLFGMSDGYVGWYENLGAGNFSSRKDISLDLEDPTGVEVGDLNGNGEIDVVSTNFNGIDGLFVNFNLGGEVFGPTQTITTAINNPYQPLVGDLDGDGDQDIVSISIADSKVAWYANSGTGSFGGQQVITTAYVGPRDAILCDFDEDGDQDIIVAMYFDNEVVLFENNGSGSFTDQVIVSGISGPWFIDVADVDGDGDKDIGVAERTDILFSWFINDDIDACSTPPTGLAETLSASSPGVYDDLLLDWDPVPGATGYRVKLKRVSPAPKKKKFWQTAEDQLPVTGFTFPGGQSFKWSVKAACVNDTTEWADPGGSFVVPTARLANSLKVYPNPASTVVYLPISTEGILRVFNISGELVLIENVNGATALDIAGWSQGLYFFETTTLNSAGEVTESGTFVKN